LQQQQQQQSAELVGWQTSMKLQCRMHVLPPAPLLRESLLLSFPPATEMFQFNQPLFKKSSSKHKQ
jgi:hypothetical protein